MSLPDQMRACLAPLMPNHVEIVDESAQHASHGASGGHFRLLIVSAQFAGKPTMQRHRMVYDALAPLMQRDIHALSITAKSLDENS